MFTHTIELQEERNGKEMEKVIWLHVHSNSLTYLRATIENANQKEKRK